MADWNPYDQTQAVDFFDAYWMFGITDGFDVVIGNPPYVRHERLGQELKNIYKNQFPEVANGSADLYVYFFGAGLKYLINNGILIFITLNKYLKTQYGIELRNFLATQYTVDLILDFFELPVFEASTDTCITKIIKSVNMYETRYYPVKNLDYLKIDELVKGSYQKVVKDKTEWKFIDKSIEPLLNKIYIDTISLGDFVNKKIYSGIKTACNEAYVLQDEVAAKLLKSESKELVQLYAKSTDIKQWKLENEQRYFLATGYDIDIRKKYPSAYKYLLQFEDILKNRQDKGVFWWNLRACAYYADFDKPKLIYIHTAVDHQFYYDTKGRYINNSCYMIISDSKFLFCFLNSKLFKWFKKIKFVAYGDATEKGRAKLDYNKMITVPIKKISEKHEKEFNSLVDKILAVKAADPQADTQALEREIDNLVYRLYNLTWDEVKVIEG
jgi:hypothetical protein